MNIYKVRLREYARSRRKEEVYIIFADNLSEARQRAKVLLETKFPLGKFIAVWEVR